MFFFSSNSTPINLRLREFIITRLITPDSFIGMRIYATEKNPKRKIFKIKNRKDSQFKKLDSLMSR
jgi:hypothetical protein